MSRPSFPLALCLAALAAPALAGTPASTTPPSSRGTQAPYVFGTTTDYAVVEVGSQAPDFSFETGPGWRRLRDLRTEGHILLVFGGADATLLALERERKNLEAIDVLPVAVVDRKPGACRALAARLGLGLRLVPDPQRVIGAQFNALDPNSRADAPAWFVLDRTGRVHALGRFAWPSRPWTEVSAHALGIELTPGTPVSFGGK